jgi:catechol 2,3-dioxygenase-like lactoylglutathione lyase family enzyme
MATKRGVRTQAGGSGTVPALDHIVLEVEDVERSMAFYREILGLEPVRWPEFRAGEAPFPSLRINAGTIIDLFPPAMWRGRQARNLNHFCLAVDTRAFAALKRRLARRGVAITRQDDHNYGARGWGRSVYVEDPDRTSVEVRHYPA